MKVELAYGREGLTVEVPDYAEVIEPVFLPGVPDEQQALCQALRHPIGSRPLVELLSPKDRVAIVFSDITRPVPNKRIIPPLVAEVEAAGVPCEQITLVNACGMHRPNTREELMGMLGEDIVNRYRIVNHNAQAEDELVKVGETNLGNQVWVNRQYMQASVRILTGFIEPHLFAGFSGGAKSVLPGVAGAKTVLRNHNYEMIAHPKAIWGSTKDNPIFQDIRQAALLTKPSFILNVTTNKAKEITGIFAGDVVTAHDVGIGFCRRSVMRPVDHLFDVVVTTNSGYPLDLDYYQSAKGMSAAAQIVQPGGDIIIASECSDGVGSANFCEMLTLRDTPQGLLEMVSQPGFSRYDQWEIQLIAQILLKARVHFYSTVLPLERLEQLHVRPCLSIEETLSELVTQYQRQHGGENPAVCVLPMGPLTLPYYQPSSSR